MLLRNQRGMANVAAISDGLALNEQGEPDRADLLVGVAYDLLDEKGLEGLTIRAVLDRSGLARRAFYDVFAGKDDLVLAVFERTLLVAARLFTEEIKAIDDPTDQMRWIIGSIVMGRMDRVKQESGVRSRRSAALAREHMRLAESRPAELQAAISPLIGLLSQIAQAGMDRGAIRAGDASAFGMLIYNLVATTAHTQLLAEEQGGVDREYRARLRDQIWDFCEHALSAG